MARNVDFSVNVDVNDNVQPSIGRLRELKKEIRNVAAGSSEFRALRAEMDDINDSLKAAKTGAGNFTDILGKIPGPIGDIGSQASMAVDALKGFGMLNMNSLKNSFKDLKDDVMTGVKGLGALTGVTGLFTKTNRSAAVSLGEVAVGEAVAETGAVTLGTTIKTVLISSGIGLLVVALGASVALLYKFATAESDTSKSVDKLTQTLEFQKEAFDNNVQDSKNAGDQKIAVMKINGAKEYQIATEVANQSVAKQKELGKRTIEAYQAYWTAESLVRNAKNTDDLKKAAETRDKALEESKKANRDYLNQISETNIKEAEALASRRNADYESFVKTSHSQYAEKAEMLKRQGKSTIDIQIQENKDLQEYNKKYHKDNTEALLAGQALQTQKLLEFKDIKKSIQEAIAVDDNSKADLEIETTQKKYKKLIELAGKNKENVKALKDAEAHELSRITGTYANKERDENIKKLDSIIADENRSYTTRLELVDQKEQEINNKWYEKESDRNKDLEDLIKQRSDLYVKESETQMSEDVKKSDSSIAKNQAIFDNETLTYEMRLEAVNKNEDDIKNKIFTSEDERTAALKANSDKRKEIMQSEFEAKQAITLAEIGLVSQLGQFMQQIAGSNKELAITGIVIEKAASIASIISNTAIANAKSVAAMPLTLGQPWVTINTIAAGLSIAGVVASAAQSISQINSAGQTSTSSESPTSSGSKYEKGGLLRGVRHAQGGISTPIGELEGGEYIINRASTQSFLPLLDRINAMGQGVQVSSGNVSSDFENKGMLSQSTQILKTYVVATEMTSEQEKQKKIRDLSRL